MIPELPSANYDVWVRGYGLVDSPKKRGRPGTTMNHTAVIAPSPKAAAEYYPAGYWYSLMRVPAESEFPGTGPEGNGINPIFKSQPEYVRLLKNNSCLGCHQMGSKGTRELHPALGSFESSVKAWERRLQSGQAGGAMARAGAADGTAHRCRCSPTGPTGSPPARSRPRRRARRESSETSSSPCGTGRTRRRTCTTSSRPTAAIRPSTPTVPLYGVLEASADYMPVLDPKTHTVSRVPVTLRDSNTPPVAPQQVAAASPYWGTEAIWTSRANVHNPMFDEKGRVWITSQGASAGQPGFLQGGFESSIGPALPAQQLGPSCGGIRPEDEGDEAHLHLLSAHTT